MRGGSSGIRGRSHLWDVESVREEVPLPSDVVHLDALPLVEQHLSPRLTLPLLADFLLRIDVLGVDLVIVRVVVRVVVGVRLGITNRELGT